MNKLLFLFFFAAVFQFPGSAQNDSLRGLQTDVMLHPGEAYTAHTLHKNEVIVSYSLTSLYKPQPLLFAWGITDRLTTELDAATTFLSYTSDYYYVFSPTAGLRYQLFNTNKKKTSLALEANFQKLSWASYEYINFGNIGIDHGGLSGSIRLNASTRIREKLHLHGSLGIGFNQAFSIYNDTGAEQFSLINSPSLSLAADWRPAPWFSTHLTLSYGHTPLQMRFTPRNYQASYSFRFAPFLNRKWGIFRTFRIEMSGYVSYFRDFDVFTGIPYPLLIQLYWQWTFHGKEKKQ